VVIHIVCVFVIGESNDVVGKRSPAAQTRTGIVYGVNPNPNPFRCFLRSCVYWAQAKEGPCLELNCVNCYQKPQVFFTQPLFKCSASDRNTVRDSNTKNVRSCHYNTTMEVMFDKPHQFWSVKDTCNQATGGPPVNLYIEDIAYLDDLNVVISVRRGPVSEYLYLVGLNSTEWPSDRIMQSRTVHYFLNMENMRIRPDTQWTHRASQISNGQYSVLCQQDTLVPIFGTFIASASIGMSLFHYHVISVVLFSIISGLYRNTDSS